MAFARCPKCNAILNVPANALGQRARCTACNAVFTIPTQQQLLDDTISAWIEHDVDEELSERDRTVEQRFKDGASDITQSKTAKSKNVSSKSISRSPEGHGSRKQVGSTVDLDDPRTKKRKIPLIQPQGDLLSESMFPIEEGAKSRSMAGQRVVEAPAPQPAEYPTELLPTEAKPYVIVEKVSSTGVHLAFDHSWLMHHGFRTTMPVRCVFSGDTKRSHLIARPLLFIDRSPSRKASYEQIIASHEHREIGDRHPREICKMMGVIEQMPDPFSFPMPYYVSTKYAHLSLHCSTGDRPGDKITCRVVVPDVSTALEWLGRVNGVWGPEYELLEQEVAMLHGEVWRNLDGECRQRIHVWCKPRPREVVKGYFLDADFGRRDAGLAGLVVTDQRIVFAKYHHKGQVPLDELDAEIHAKVDEKMASLSLIVGSERSRMVKLHLSDLKALRKLLEASSDAIKLRIHDMRK